ncbi:ROK family transcriptional regulator [Paenibacillus sp. IB182496]|uniref:ROK family transcriptional regulator n=1 Tax=Paenibacillus sabuli TaxID=2772509 RepID=A0A927BWL6_9BACL|nr:ROK family transcriptional regulator [Paenibacillus sabuli]MBD2847085.1 ROK family transcriptional regulator [Paenibacillus sabuli]
MGLVNVKELNYKRIIKVIREQGPISRIDISALTNIPQPTITRITEELIGDGIIMENGSVPSARGRRPVQLVFNRDCFFSIGIQLSRSRVKVAIMNMEGDALALRHRYDTRAMPFGEVMQFVHRAVDQVIAEAAVAPKLVLGIGVVVPGPLDETEEGEVSPPDFYGQSRIPLRRLLHEAHHLPVMMDNNANAAAIAEKWFGKGIGRKHFMTVLAENGIGSGLIVSDHLLRGDTGEAGVIGHTTIDYAGERCSCGNYGCVETFVSIRQIEENVRRKLKLAPGEERERFPADLDALAFADIVLALEQGSALCEQAMREAGSYLGIGIANAVNLLNPEAIILSGKLGTATPILAKAVQETIRARVLSAKGKRTPVEVSELENAIVLGAGALVIDDTFSFF